MIGNFLRRCFRLVTEKACFSFAVALFSTVGSFAAIPGLIFVWATVDFSTTARSFAETIIMCVVLIAVAALLHYFFYGAGYLFGRRYELGYLKSLNIHVRELTIPPDIDDASLNELVSSLERLPYLNTAMAASLSSVVVIVSLLQEVLVTHNWNNGALILEGSLISWVIYLMFTLLITEMLTTDLRRDARWLQAMRDNWVSPRGATSLVLKFGFIMILMVISSLVTYGITSSTAIHSRVASFLIFTGMILIVGLCLSLLIFQSIRKTLHELMETASEVSEGQCAQFISGSIDREFIDTASSIYSAAQKIAEYREELQSLNADLELKVQERTAEIKLLSITDPLTGCYNRGYLSETLPIAISTARSLEQSFALIMCDLDHFKFINDTFGHQAGDQVLCEFIQCIKRIIRTETDWVARYGGEEFIIVLPKTEVEGAARVAERMRQTIEFYYVVVGNIRISFTTSFGVTGFTPDTPEEGLDADKIINRADQLLYQAKLGGRNRVLYAEFDGAGQ